MVNPARKWRFQLSDVGELRLTDALAVKTRERIIYDLASDASQYQLFNSDGAVIFDIDYEGYLKTDLKVRKTNPSLIVTETASATYYPRIDIINPQRSWRLQLDSTGRLRLRDLTAAADRLVIDENGNFSSIASATISGSANVGSLQIAGTTVIDSARQLQNISAIIQDVFQTKASPTFRITETASATTYPRLELYNPQRNWRIFNSSDGSLNIYDVSAAVYRLRFFYSTAANSEQLRVVNSAGTTIMSIDYEGDVTIPGKLTQGACPEFSKMSLNEIKNFLKKCVSKPEPRKDGNGRDICDLCNKPFSEDGCTDPKHWNNHIETHYHRTQEEVMALMHLVLNLVERVEQLEHRLGVAY